ncbi:MAG TPA: hypothetical protein VE242_04940 [Chthoniobacterales bacterium]|nr:hypothetical protein [Chthoniobacterales bacterium]
MGEKTGMGKSKERSTFLLRVFVVLLIPAKTVHRTRAEIRTINLLFEKLAAETIFVENPR